MTGPSRGRSARFVLAPVDGGVVDWGAGVDVVLAPIRLSTPVLVTLSGGRPRGGAR